MATVHQRSDVFSLSSSSNVSKPFLVKLILGEQEQVLFLENLLWDKERESLNACLELLLGRISVCYGSVSSLATWSR